MTLLFAVVSAVNVGKNVFVPDSILGHHTPLRCPEMEKHEIRSTKYEIRSTKSEARSTKHEIRSTKHEFRISIFGFRILPFSDFEFRILAFSNFEFRILPGFDTQSKPDIVTQTMSDNKPSHEELYELYRSFVQDEQGFNSKIRDGAIDWYRDIVGIGSHFERGVLDTAAKAEPLTIKRVLMLNAFEHIAAMDRAYAMRCLDYANYFARRDVSLEDDSKTMDRALNFFYRTVTQRI